MSLVPSATNSFCRNMVAKSVFCGATEILLRITRLLLPQMMAFSLVSLVVDLCVYFDKNTTRYM
uniref:Uncharacterized protein n=2 Tax=Physcomitrium patens TaxID=3218 RepID=A0A2K1K6M0_PHYPA|nr:hypothetical protein PHYPA_011316 [Physcomitrium patens]